MADQTKKSKKRLGKGLGGLLSKPVVVEAPIIEPTGDTSPAHGGGDLKQSVSSREAGTQKKESEHTEMLVYLDIQVITPNPHQPRQVFDDDGLASLANSITTAGLMQPVIVRRSAQDPELYELIAGERRWRAATIAGLTSIPSIIRNLDDRTSAEWSLIENLQREDLNPIDRAEAFDHLIVAFNSTQQEIATQLGIDRSSVSNFLRLNDLDPSVKDAVRDGRLSMGHAKVLLSIPDVSTCKAIAQKCATQQWSVRELERQLRKQASKKKSIGQAESDDPRSMYIENLSNQLGEHLGTKVQILFGSKKGAGKISISFYDNDQFDGLLEKLQFSPTS